MKYRWKKSNKSVFNLGYHIIFCPKYRRKVLVGEVETRLKELIKEKCESLNIKIESMEVMSDHVHLFLKPETTVHAPHFIVGQIKGFSSKILREEFPDLKSRLPTLWTRSYYVESVGNMSEYVIKKYIENQKNV